MPHASTRDLMVGAGIQLFGQRGFEATSLRQIAQAAGGQNVALVSYYFGSKDGLRRACADEIVARLQRVIARASLLQSPPPDRPQSAVHRIEAMMMAVTDYMTQVPEAEDVAAFVLRELAAESPAFDIIYSGLIEPLHSELCALWGMATGRQADDDATLLSVFAMIGQILYFRIGRNVVTRRLGWAGVGASEAKQIKSILLSNLHASLAANPEVST